MSTSQPVGSSVAFAAIARSSAASALPRGRRLASRYGISASGSGGTRRSIFFGSPSCSRGSAFPQAPQNWAWGVVSVEQDGQFTTERRRSHSSGRAARLRGTLAVPTASGWPTALAATRPIPMSKTAAATAEARSAEERW